MRDKWGDESALTLLECFKECESLPEGWSINLHVYADEASLSLVSPNGDDVEVCHDDLTTGEFIREMVRVARAIDAGKDPHDDD